MNGKKGSGKSSSIDFGKYNQGVNRYNLSDFMKAINGGFEPTSFPGLSRIDVQLDPNRGTLTLIDSEGQSITFEDYQKQTVTDSKEYKRLTALKDWIERSIGTENWAMVEEHLQKCSTIDMVNSVISKNIVSKYEELKIMLPRGVDASIKASLEGCRTEYKAAAEEGEKIEFMKSVRDAVKDSSLDDITLDAKTFPWVNKMAVSAMKVHKSELAGVLKNNTEFKEVSEHKNFASYGTNALPAGELNYAACRDASKSIIVLKDPATGVTEATPSVVSAISAINKQRGIYRCLGALRTIGDGDSISATLDAACGGTRMDLFDQPTATLLGKGTKFTTPKDLAASKKRYEAAMVVMTYIRKDAHGEFFIGDALTAEELQKLINALKSTREVQATGALDAAFF